MELWGETYWGTEDIKDGVCSRGRTEGIREGVEYGDGQPQDREVNEGVKDRRGPRGNVRDRVGEGSTENHRRT